MRILVIAPYPPARDGIAAYTVQSVARLRRAGHDVEVLSPYPSAAQHHLQLNTVRGAMQLGRVVRGYDKIVLQYHPEIFFRPETPAFERERIAAALALAWRAARAVEIRVHEADYSRSHRGAASLGTQAMWRSATRIVVHTETERRAFRQAYGLPLERIMVEPHGSDFTRRTALSRRQARLRLRLPEDEVVFLSIGFIQPHKGFDRAIRAFAAARPSDGGARLDVVGSVRVNEPAYVTYLDEVRRLAEATPGAHLHTGYISDEEFDTWIVAADVVVLPYRHIWSSGVFERAAMYQRPVIATQVGGLTDQARADTVLVADDAALMQAMQRVLTERAVSPGPPRRPAVPWPAPSKATRSSVMRAVQARAAMERGGPVPASGVTGEMTDARNGGDALAGSAPLRRLRPLHLPAPVSTRLGGTPAKRLVQRLTRWELDPIVEQLNQLQRAMAEAVERSPRDSDPTAHD